MRIESGLLLLFIAGNMFKEGKCRSALDNPVLQAACNSKYWTVKNLVAVRVGDSGKIEVSWHSDSWYDILGRYELSHYVAERRTDVPKFLIVTGTKVTLDDLLPGWNYSISVQRINIRCKPTESVIHLVTQPASPTSLHLKSVEEGFIVSWQPDEKSRQEKFKITYKSTSDERYEEISMPQSHINLTHLDAGASYKIGVIAISYGIESRPVSKNQTVVPHPPINFTIKKVWSNGVSISWEPPRDSVFTEFVIRYEFEIADESPTVLPRSKLSRDAEIDNLTPGQLYIIRINTVSYELVESLKSPTVNQTIPPNPVLNFTLTSNSTKYVVLDWLRPEGRVDTYMIKWWQVKNSADIHTKNVTENHVSAIGLKDGSQMKRKRIIGDLIPGVEYLFSIRAVSHNSVSNQAKMGLGPDKIPISAPPQPRPQDVPTIRRTSRTVIETRIRKDCFSEENGKIISYSIIVAENYSIDASMLQLMNWHEVQKYPIWPPYEVKVQFDIFKDGLVADFRIGDDICEGEMGFCNGPLRSGSTYVFKLRGFTALDKFTDTHYSRPIKTEPTAGDGLDAKITRRIGNYNDIHVTWDSPESFPDFYIVKLTLNGLESDDSPFHNVSGTETETRFSNVTISGGFNVSVTAWTSGVEGLEIVKRSESLLKCIRRTDLMIPCLAGGIAAVSGIGIAICGYFRLRKRRLQSQNQQLDEYEMSPERLTITRVLGNGAFGIVKLGSLRDDQGNLTNVAVKMLRDDSNENDLRSFLDEIKIMKTLDKHPNIVSLVGCCTIGQYPTLVVEYCSRGDLHSFLRKSLEKKTAPVEEARKCTVISKILPKGKEILIKNCDKSSTSRIEDGYVQVSYSADDQDTNCDPDTVTVLDMLNFGRQIATGMVFLSSNRIVHRDLATRNVLVCYDRTMKISDFGLSRDIYQENFYKKSGNGRMPLKWMAIEALTHQVYSTHSDVWSFGILLWEIVTLGGVPYPEVPTMELLKLLQSGYRMERPENCSIPLHDVMLSCWQTKPGDRPTFTMLRRELGKLISMNTENEYLDLNGVSEQVSAEPLLPRLQNIV